MGIDQAREERGARQVDRPAALAEQRREWLAGDVGDARALDDDRWPFDHGRTVTREKAPGADDRDGIFVGHGGLRSGSRGRPRKRATTCGARPRKPSFKVRARPRRRWLAAPRAPPPSERTRLPGE